MGLIPDPQHTKGGGKKNEEKSNYCKSTFGPKKQTTAFNAPTFRKVLSIDSRWLKSIQFGEMDEAAHFEPRHLDLEWQVKILTGCRFVYLEFLGLYYCVLCLKWHMKR